MESLINISIDDVSPHPKSSIKVLDRCFELINKFPDIKFSLFIPISYWRTIRPDIATQTPLQIDLFPKFCKAIAALPEKNFELCYHGFHHGIPGKSDNDEFQYLDYDHAIERFNAMFKVIKLSNLENKFKMIFRPPAWRMSTDAIKASIDMGFEVLALSPDEYAQKTYGTFVDTVDNVVYYNCNPPHKPLNIFPKTEVVYHACEWDKNYLDVKKQDELSKFIENNIENLKFSFLKELI